MITQDPLSLDSEIAETVRLPPAQRFENGHERNLTGQPLQELFEPDRIALVGASDRDDSIGSILLSNLTEDFAGDVVPINPGRNEIAGQSAYPHLVSVPGTVDLAIVAVAADRALDAIRQAGRKGIDNVVVIAGGFSEASENGRERERELRQIADAYDLTVIGPNSMGIMASGRGLNATFAPASPDPGGISVTSQSGAFITALLDWGEDAGVGFNTQSLHRLGG
jgi:acyl-CoA synthetase (NDP forming)